MAFERLLTTGRGDDEGTLDAGALAEGLLFYQSVHVLAGIRLLNDLVRAVGVASLVELMDRGNLHVSYVNNLAVCQTRNDGVIEYHRPAIISADEFALERVVRDAVGLQQPKAERQRAQRDLMDRIHATRHDETVTTHARDWLAKAEWAEHCVRELLREYGVRPSQAERARFIPTLHDGGFTVDTDIDFNEVNRARLPHLAPLTPARIVANVTGACAEFAVASRAGADIRTHPHTSAIISTMVEAAIRGSVAHARNLEAFQEVTLGSGHAIAEAVNGGTRDFGDVVRLLDGAAKFRSWLSERAPNANLLASYYAAISRDSWVSSLPGKAFRWLVPTVAGGAVAGLPGMLAGAGLSALDTFVIDGIAKGWRPNQFVDGPLKRFTSA